MSLAKVIEIIAESPTSFEDAVREGVAEACARLNYVTNAWVKDQKVVVVDGKITAYRVTMHVTFLLASEKHKEQGPQ